MTRRKKTYPQLIAIEATLVAAFALAAYFLLPKAGVPHSVALIATGAAADRALIMLLRHRNKPAGWKLPFSVTMTPAKRKPAPRGKS